MNATTQAHSKKFAMNPSLHVPPFSHGDDAHSSMSMWHVAPVKPAVHTHANESAEATQLPPLLHGDESHTPTVNVGSAVAVGDAASAATVLVVDEVCAIVGTLAQSNEASMTKRPMETSISIKMRKKQFYLILNFPQFSDFSLCAFLLCVHTVI